jgi:putative ABC transport system permease protein
VTLAAITFGLTAVVMAVGLDSTLTQINHSAVQSQGQVQVALLQGRGSLTSQIRQQQRLAAALRTQPGTLRYAGEAETGAPGTRPVITVPVLAQVPVNAYDGDPGWLQPGLISGRWYHSPGEVDADAPFLTQAGLSVGDTMTMTVNGKPVTVRIVGEAFVISDDPTLLTSWQTLGSAAADLAWQYDIELKPGTSTQAYVSGLGHFLGPGFAVVAAPQSASSFAATADTSLIGLLTVVIAVLAGLGVLNSVLMLTRERVRDLGVFKAVGMTPRQTIAMVICWIIPPAVIAAAIALPAGIMLQHVVAQAIGAVAGTGIPGSYIDVYGAVELLLLALAGLAIAIAGALGPAGWAAAAKTTTALHAE